MKCGQWFREIYSYVDYIVCSFPTLDCRQVFTL